MKTVFLLFVILIGVLSLPAQTDDRDYEIKNSLELQFPDNKWPSRSNDVYRFNKDTILACGYFNRDKSFQNTRRFLYLTFNCGKSWVITDSVSEFSEHPGYLPDGKAWFNSGKGLKYSTNFGATWTDIPGSSEDSLRLYYIFMQDSLHGIGVGSRVMNEKKEFGVFVTNDNWIGVRAAPTPVNQLKHKSKSWFYDGRVIRIERLGDVLLINQGGRIYYSRLYPVNWKAFNVPVKDFSVDPKNKTITLTGIRNRKYILNSKLDLVTTYSEPEKHHYKEPMYTGTIDVDAFLASGIKKLIYKIAKFHYENKGSSCYANYVYREKVNTFIIKDRSVFPILKNILTHCDSIREPTPRLFEFSNEDIADYWKLYNTVKSNRKADSERDGRYHYEWINIDHDLFLHPEKTTDCLTKENLQTVYNTYRLYSILYTLKGAYLTIDVVNNNSDTLKIKSKSLGDLNSLPYTVTFRGESMDTYDTEISKFLRTSVPKRSPFYNNLSAGELIFRLIEQRIIDETEYINENK